MRRSTLLPGGQSDVVYLQLDLHDPETVNSDDEIQTVDLTIIPSDVTYPTAEELTTSSEPSSSTFLLFEALSACANLHPDPASPGSDGEHEPAPGTGGWITAENMSDYLDADGNFMGIPSLGPGAGVVHAREEDTKEVNGTDETDDAKWHRTD
jgi:chloride channel, nucleotide-sensitive, 1A